MYIEMCEEDERVELVNIIPEFVVKSDKNISVLTYVLTYLIGHYNPSVRNTT